MKIANLIFPFLFITILLSSCKEGDDMDDEMVTTFDIFMVQADRTTVLMNGEIKSRTLDDFNKMLQDHPDIDLINMDDVPGSGDDEINFQVGVLLRQNGINTHLVDNAEVASGGVDFFLAGTTRTRGNGAKLGVHSWADNDGNEATDFPMESEEHRPNIQYYEDLGYSAQ